MSTSPNLSLPYIQPSQAQKHVTHNLAIERLDALVQLSVNDLQASEPPAAPFDGQVTVVAVGATGEFEGEDGNLAYRTNGAWMFVPPRNGFKAWVESRAAFYVHQDGLWHRLLAVGDDTADGLGLNTTWDATNRLSVAAPATLLTHEGAGHQLKINKAAADETASLLLQDGFSGRAEMGLTGDDNFSVKVSADGTGWSTALTVDAATGDLEMGRIKAAALAGEAVQAAPTDTTAGRLMRADWGYGPGNAVGTVSEAGGTPTGAIVERGETENGTYVRWADGTQICHAVSPILTCDSFIVANVFHGSLSHNWLYPAPFAAMPTVSLTPYRESGAHAHFAMIGGGGLGAVSVRVYLLAAQSDAQGTIQMTAIGRWF